MCDDGKGHVSLLNFPGVKGNGCLSLLTSLTDRVCDNVMGLLLVDLFDELGVKGIVLGKEYFSLFTSLADRNSSE